MSPSVILRLTAVLALLCTLLVAGAKALGHSRGIGIVSFHDVCSSYLLDISSGRIELLYPPCSGEFAISATRNRITWATINEVHVASLSFSIANDRRTFSSDERLATHPVWSSDGQHIAYWALESTVEYGFIAELRIVSPDTGNFRSLGRFTVAHFDMAWSADWIAFAASQDGDEEIYTINVNTREVRQLTDNEFPDTMPSWSPDGQQLVFASAEEGLYELHIVNVASGERYQLTHGMGAFDPSWSPDGIHIAFLSAVNRYNRIYMVNVDGTTPTPVMYPLSISVAGLRWLP